MNHNVSISVIVPVHNEIELLERSVNHIDRFLNLHFAAYEIVVVESGSTDGTAEVCDTIARHNSRVKVIHEGARKGFGSALRLGYQNAEKDLVWMITADTPFLLEVILDALPLLVRYDCVLSYRSLDKRKLRRRLQSSIYNALVKLVLGLKVRHVNSAFKVFKTSVVQRMPLVSKGWLIDAETLYWLKEMRISFIEMPVELIERPAGVSSINLLTPLSMLIELIGFVWNVRLQQR